MITARREERRSCLAPPSSSEPPPRHTESSQLRLDELIVEAQAMASVDGTFEHMGQAFAASNHSAKKTVFHKIILQKETVVHE